LGDVSQKGELSSQDSSTSVLRRPRVLAALVSLYLIWGSTYLAIWFAIDTLPPFLMAGFRFVVAGGLLYGWARSRGAPHPSLRFWRTAAVTGALMLAGGNGAVVWAELFVPTGLVALLVATVPLWIVLLDWAWGKGRAPAVGTILGVLWGFAGVVLLITGGEIGQGSRNDLLGGLLVLGGAAAWATGSVVSRYAARPSAPGIGTAMQMLCGGLVLLAIGLARGEIGTIDPGQISAASVLALCYLVVFGSLVAFSAYIWLLRNTTPAVAVTYAYVNPVVALFLGWALVGEPLTSRTLLAALIILSAVLVITTRPSSRPSSA
ncbi:MAG: EamA family transporter, partial [Gemmatimonadetes bacterium]|nr:EamA family transporter [Gemmatimonadota bacterium]